MALKDKLMERAQAHLAKGVLDKAIIEYKAAFDADPKDISIRLRIGDLYVKMGRKTEAVEEYKEVAKANSQRGFYLKAIAVYKQVLKLEETNYEVHYKLAELYAKQRLISDAIGEYSLLVSSFEKKGKTGEVMQLLKEMLDIDSDNIGVRLKLAELYQKLNFENDALGEYAVIFTKYMAQDKLDKAEKTFTTLYKTYPKDIRILKGLSELYKKRHDDEKYLKFTKAVFSVYVERRDEENAKIVCEAILEVAPKDVDCLNYLGKGPKEPAPAKGKAGAALKQPLNAAPLISFPELSEALAPEEGAPLISFPEVGESSKPEEAPSLLQPEEEPMISFPETGIKVDLGGEQGKEAAPHEPLFEVESEAPVEEFGVSEEEGGESALDISEVKTQVAKFEMPGAAAQREVDAIFNTVASDVLGGVSGQGAPEAVTPSAPEEEVAEEIVFEVTPDEAREEAAEEIAFEATPDGTREEAAEEITFETAPEEEAVTEVAAEEVIELAPHEEASVEIEEEIIAGYAEPDSGAAQEKAAFTHDDLTKSITELTELHELVEMVEEPPDEAVVTEAAPEAAMGVEAEKTGGGDDFVDLSKELGMEDALSDLAGSWGMGASQESFDEFKTGIGNQLNKEDSETHFNLGIAYMEMELIGEAVKEFKIALKDPRLEFDCYTRLAMCAMSEGKHDDAIGYYTKGLRVTGRNDEERKGTMYELALAYEAAEKFEEAGKLYAAVSAVDPNYRETAKKVRMISETVHTIPMVDGMFEVELM